MLKRWAVDTDFFFFCYVMFISNVDILSYGIGHRYMELEKKMGEKI